MEFVYIGLALLIIFVIKSLRNIEKDISESMIILSDIFDLLKDKTGWKEKTEDEYIEEALERDRLIEEEKKRRSRHPKV